MPPTWRPGPCSQHVHQSVRATIDSDDSMVNDGWMLWKHAYTVRPPHLLVPASPRLCSCVQASVQGVHPQQPVLHGRGHHCARLGADVAGMHGRHLPAARQVPQRCDELPLLLLLLLLLLPSSGRWVIGPPHCNHVTEHSACCTASTGSCRRLCHSPSGPGARVPLSLVRDFGRWLRKPPIGRVCSVQGCAVQAACSPACCLQAPCIPSSCSAPPACSG